MRLLDGEWGCPGHKHGDEQQPLQQVCVRIGWNR